MGSLFQTSVVYLLLDYRAENDENFAMAMHG